MNPLLPYLNICVKFDFAYWQNCSKLSSPFDPRFSISSVEKKQSKVKFKTRCLRHIPTVACECRSRSNRQIVSYHRSNNARPALSPRSWSLRSSGNGVLIFILEYKKVHLPACQVSASSATDKLGLHSHRSVPATSDHNAVGDHEWRRHCGGCRPLPVCYTFASWKGPFVWLDLRELNNETDTLHIRLKILPSRTNPRTGYEGLITNKPSSFLLTLLAIDMIGSHSMSSAGIR